MSCKELPDSFVVFFDPVSWCARPACSTVSNLADAAVEEYYHGIYFVPCCSTCCTILLSKKIKESYQQKYFADAPSFLSKLRSFL